MNKELLELEPDHPARVKARKDQKDPWIMYLIVRSSLNMGSGKLAAQVAHAVAMIYEKYIQINKIIESQPKEDLKDLESICYQSDNFLEWSVCSFRKIVLKANENQWLKLKELECFVVKDAGLTEVAPETETVIGFWPMKKSQVLNIIKKLQCLK